MHSGSEQLILNLGISKLNWKRMLSNSFSVGPLGPMNVKEYTSHISEGGGIMLK